MDERDRAERMAKLVDDLREVTARVLSEEIREELAHAANVFGGMTDATAQKVFLATVLLALKIVAPEEARLLCKRHQPENAEACKTCKMEGKCWPSDDLNLVGFEDMPQPFRDALRDILGGK